MHFYHHSLGCSLVFVNSGMYRILYHHHNSSDISNGSFYIDLENKESAEDCCLDLVDLHPPPPNWANNANPTYDGIVLDKYSQKIARRWSFDNISSKTTAAISILWIPWTVSRKITSPTTTTKVESEKANNTIRRWRLHLENTQVVLCCSPFRLSWVIKICILLLTL